MKITLFHVLFVAVSFTLIANGMNKNSKPIIMDLRDSKLEVISRVWKVEQVLLNDSIDRTTDFKDYSFEFKDNGKYIFSGLKNQIEGTWEFAGGETKLILNKNTSQEEMVDILLLNQIQLHMGYSQSTHITGFQKASFKLK
jgi:hypothetical protein